MLKRILDFFISLILLIILSPLLIFVTIILLKFMGKPIIFKQERVGKDGHIFTLYKFRTMKNTYDQEGTLLPDSNRLTRLGKFLRKTSIDELPELINVIKGDMSLVGPRPLRVRYTNYYTQEELRRHNVRPGITGLAQVSGRNYLSWSKRLDLDTYYVDNMSFWLDINIILRTIVYVIKCKDVSTNSRKTCMPLDEERKMVKGFFYTRFRYWHLEKYESEIKNLMFEHYMLYEDISYKDLNSEYRKLVKKTNNDNNVIMAVFNNDNLIAYTWVGTDKKLGKKVLSIHQFIIDDDLMDKGVGNKLLTKALTSIDFTKIDYIDVSISKHNYIVLNYFINEGYEISGFNLTFNLKNNS